MNRGTRGATDGCYRQMEETSQRRLNSLDMSRSKSSGASLEEFSGIQIISITQERIGEDIKNHRAIF